jgi:hypothetical protein
MQPEILDQLVRERHARLLAQAADERRFPRHPARQRVGSWLITAGSRVAGGEPAWAPPRQATSS